MYGDSLHFYLCLKVYHGHDKTKEPMTVSSLWSHFNCLCVSTSNNTSAKE